MEKGYAEMAVASVLNSEMSYCKFLSANDSGATGAHQAGILISKSAVSMMFSPEDLDAARILKRPVVITWQDDFFTAGTFTYYASKNELRLTGFGRGFPFLNPEQTGSLFVFTRQTWEDYSGYFLDTEEEIESFLSAVGISPTETNRLIDTGGIREETREKAAIRDFISGLDVYFPESDVMSATARNIDELVYNHSEYIASNPDKKLIDWTNMEYTLFRELENARYGEIIRNGFASVEDFVKKANEILNRRKSRAGKSLEHHLEAIFDWNGIEYTPQAITEGRKKPDFIFPSDIAYHDFSFPADKLVSLAAKTTCKDRWRQVLNEADRLKDGKKYLCTLQQGISAAQMDEMEAENVVLVVPKGYIKTYPTDRQNRIWNLLQFVQYVKHLEGK